MYGEIMVHVTNWKCLVWEITCNYYINRLWYQKLVATITYFHRWPITNVSVAILTWINNLIFIECLFNQCPNLDVWLHRPLHRGWASNCIWKYYRNWLLIHALIPGILCWKETILTRWGLDNIDGLVQERRNSSALAMELRLSCTNPSICSHTLYIRELILYENCILIQRSNLQYATRV